MKRIPHLDWFLISRRALMLLAALWYTQAFSHTHTFSLWDQANRNGEAIYSTLDTFPFLKNKPKLDLGLEEYGHSSFIPDPIPDIPAYECHVIFEGRDNATGDRKKELAYEPLFSYTPSHIKPYLPGEDLLEAQSKFVRFSGGYTFLVVNFRWNAQSPDNIYGRLKTNGAIRFLLTDQKTVTLFNSEEQMWTYNAEEELYEMSAFYMLHPRQVKLLKSNPLVRTMVYWERGFEEYPIYSITLFQNQLRCLE